MGIPRLLRNLETYATPIVLGGPGPTNSEENLKKSGADSQNGGSSTLKEQGQSAKKIVIDGPGLAYHAYYRAVARRQRARNAMEAMPPYAEVGAVALEFISTLEAAGIEIAAIFFDGFLPEAKRDTRIKRLETYLKQLVNFHSSHSSGPSVTAQSVSTEDDIFAPRPLSVKMKALPASPFLVPSVIERLQDSRYGAVTHVVAAEADAFCADYVRKEGGWLLTSDSDLLVHDLGSNGSVVLFRDINRIILPGRSTIKAVEYCPTRIAQTLGLKTLAPLAYALLQDPNRTVKECVKIAKEKDTENPYYRAFLAEYASLEIPQSDPLIDPLPPPGTSPPPALPGLLRTLDPRTSEYVHQILPPFPSLAAAAPSTTTATTAPPQPYMIYLPFLLDDPTRASAWRPSALPRHLGYSLLALLLLPPHASTIHEFERKGPRIAATAVARLSQNDVERACAALAGSLQRALDACDGLSRAKAWRVAAAFWLCEALAANEDRFPSRAEMALLLRGQRGVLSWGYVHRVAQVQAVLYSWRMLRQLGGVFLAAACGGERVAGRGFGCVARVEEVQRLLETMPTLAELCDWAELGVGDDDDDVLEEVVRKFPSTVHADEEAFTETTSTGGGSSKNAKKKKRKRKQSAADQDRENATPAHQQRQQQQKSTSSNNMYSLLGES